MKSSECGNGMLEMLLFMPIAFAILFVGVDTGISMIDRAMLKDALRESVNLQVASGVSGLFTVTQEGIQPNEDKIADAVTAIGQQMDSIIQERRIKLGTGDAPVQVVVRAVMLSIDEEMGVLTSYRILDSPYYSPHSFDISAYVPSISSGTYQEFLDTKVQGAYQDARYGVYSPVPGTDRLFLPESLFFLVSLEAVAPAISPLWQNTVLGSRIGVQLHEFSSYRN